MRGSMTNRNEGVEKIKRKVVGETVEQKYRKISQKGEVRGALGEEELEEQQGRKNQKSIGELW